MNTNEILKQIEENEIIGMIKDHADNAEIYLVGGTIRDFYFGKENFDKDIIILNADAKEFAQTLAQKINAAFIPLDEENKIYRLVLSDKINYIDVTNAIGNSLDEDLKRRDLTINAIAINLKTFEIIDVTGGINDLIERKIKPISEQNFIDDPLRLLRVYRFQAMLGFDIDKDLTEIVTKHAKKIHASADERINYELMKMFSGDFSAQALIDMDKTGLLEEIFPVINDLKKVPPNSHHHLDLFSHSIEVVNQIQKIYESSDIKVQEHLLSNDFGGNTRLAHLKLAGFLHDIGKFSTWTIEEEQGCSKHRFIKHDDIGSKMAVIIFKTAKFSKKQIDYIAKMIKNHIYPSHVVCAPDLNEKIQMRFVRKMENEVIDIIILAMADRLSARGVEITQEVVNQNIGALNLLLNFYLNIKDTLKPLPKLLSGEEIMEMLNISPSKELGLIISSIHEAQLSGDLTTKEEAIEFVKRVNCKQ